MTTELQLLTELKREVVRLREDFAKFRQAAHKTEKEQEQWVPGKVLCKMFGTNYRELYILRHNNSIRHKTEKPGVVRYLLSSAEQYFNNKKTES
jgi:hypothetical protein